MLHLTTILFDYLYPSAREPQIVQRG